MTFGACKYVVISGPVKIEVSFRCLKIRSFAFCWRIAPQDETWTNVDGPLWIQYDLFRKNKQPGSIKVNLVKLMQELLSHSENIVFHEFV